MKAQHRDPKQLVMCGQDGAGQIVEAVLALLAPVALPVSLRVIMAVASYRPVLLQATDNRRSPMTAHQLTASRIVNRRREVHQG
jgi:hypothetical protein